MTVFIADQADVSALPPMSKCLGGRAAAHDIGQKAQSAGAGAWHEIGRRYCGSR